MKKYIGMLLFVFLFSVLATGKIIAQNKQQDRIQDPTTHETDVYVSEEDVTQQQNGIVKQGLQNAIKSLNKVTQRINNPETGQQIRNIIQKQEQAQIRTEAVLKQMNQRRASLKLLIGPDYKNAGQLRSDVVGLRNDISQLTKLKETVSSADSQDIQGAIDELQVEESNLENQLEQQLSGFSLFGWLAKLLAAY